MQNNNTGQKMSPENDYCMKKSEIFLSYIQEY